uniref:DNA-directed RNA polymerase subunit N n=1 Tax=viral metagenome TaxID=1070528 RepID=A0A6C0CZU5_9ZZZZ
MLIPIRCFTCNNIIADKWDPFIIMSNMEKNKDEKENDNKLDIKYINLKNNDKSIEGKVLDDLGLKKYCCRRMMLSNVHLISYIN